MNAPRFPQVLLAGLCVGLLLSRGSAGEVVDNDPMKVRGAPGFPIKNPIDSYVLAKLNEAKISPSRKCSDEEFIRRASLDVIGVIPTIDAIQYFLADPRSDKRERLIDSLLANERYGAHWAILWGDLLREHSQTRQEEGSYPGTYRNWIRDALNANMSYDQFMTKLITSDGRADQDGAVNFYLRDANDRVETANTISSAFMGTRMACAQCHDHPFDKWEQKDFHSLMAFISPRVSVRTDDLATLARLSKVPNLDPDVAAKVKPFADQAASLLKERDAWEEKLEKEGKKPEPQAAGNGGNNGNNGGRRRRGGERGNPNDQNKGPAAADDPNAKAQDLIKKMRAAVAALGQDKSDRFNQLFGNIRVNVVRENTGGEYRMPNDGDGAVNGRGNEVVPPVFPWDQAKKAGGDRREDLAKFIAAAPLFAQVHANRLWAGVMGRGLVDPPDDFRPKNVASHPELLQYLADELVRSKFDAKHVLRLILTSSTYERSSVPESSNKADTTLYSRRQLRRMTAEQLFDSILVATGQADPKVNLAMAAKAPDLKAPEPSKKLPSGTGFVAPSKPAAPANAGGSMMGGMMGMMNASDNESGVWAFDQPTPSNLGSFMNTFNQPSREQFTFQRDSSATITQALELFNGRPINDAVKKDKNMMVQVLIDKKLNIVQIVQDLYMATLSRLPNGQESQVAIGYVGSNARNRLEDLHWALMNTREFMFIK
ncbi:MAG: DUF1549 domain-containing protein [Planctomycetota bacterium]|nr:DUF1549 domain-containing protein [Planctomycetota bacterium]